jgi:iron complex transport system ATP-binding protein
MGDQIVFERVRFRYPDGDADVFTDLDLALPPGMVSLLGQNGTGKSTLLLLAAGSLLPDSGRVLIRGRDSRELGDEQERHRLVSAIWQNLEFETEEPIDALLGAVYDGGFHSPKRAEAVGELVEAFELSPFLGRRTQDVSKGELQRTILAFSLLYGSPIVVMDEPMFALEDRQKRAAMAFLQGYTRREGVSLYFSVHEMDLSRDYSDHLLLFSKNAKPRLGPTAELFTRETIEQAYEAPFDMLKRREELYRAYLTQLLRNRGPGA